MANMSYCKFQNTVIDYKDCLFTIEEEGVDNLSKEEMEALKNLYKFSKRFIEELEYGDYNLDFIKKEED